MKAFLVYVILNLIVINVHAYKNITVASTWFIDEIFEHYADNINQSLSLKGLCKYNLFLILNFKY